jgi:hypothetical protein
MWRQASLPAVKGGPACGTAWKNRLHGEKLKFEHGFRAGYAVPPGWKPRLYVRQDGRRCHFQTAS